MVIIRGALFFLFLFASVGAAAQVSPSRRPVPYPVFTSPAFQNAIKKGTRTATGEPGKSYWMNKASYRIQAVLSPETAVLSGEEVIRYQNNSPDTLWHLSLYLLQNLHHEGVERNRPVEVTGGMTLSKVMVEKKPMTECRQPHRGAYEIDGTLLSLYLEEPLLPGKKIELGFSWSFKIPKDGGPRMGQDGEVFFLGYWYPEMAVYDDVSGWADHAYMGAGEFYMDYADYEVEVTVPQGWLVAATGVLQNPDEVLSRQTRS
ncbi:MAG: M1 family metallopeptidase, partial [Chlorobiales bacterium]|nr:M1 family metallopeptidase [Chlorobiales bacterium]